MADVYTRIGYIKGATGATGAQGAKGDQGDAATIAVGTVTTVPYGQTANVVNSGTSGAAVFDFTIPQGRPGEQTTDMQNLTLGSITTSSASFPVPAVGETGKVLWGKVVKWFSDMSALVATKLNVANVVNNLTTTASGYALDARQGKALNDTIAALVRAIPTTNNTDAYTQISTFAWVDNSTLYVSGYFRNTGATIAENTTICTIQSQYLNFTPSQVNTMIGLCQCDDASVQRFISLNATNSVLTIKTGVGNGAVPIGKYVRFLVTIPVVRTAY